MVTRRIKWVLWWRRSGIMLRLSVFALGSLLLAFLVYTQRPQDDSVYEGSNLQIFLLVNFLIIVLCILAFLVGRNIIKLIFDRRRKILGSRLRLRLVGAFLFLTLVPTSILFVLASGLLTNAFEGWFSAQIETSVSSAVELAKQHYNFVQSFALRETGALAKILEGEGLIRRPEQLNHVLEKRRTDLEFFSLRVIEQTRGSDKLIGEAASATAGLDEFREPALNQELLHQAFAGRRGVDEEGIEASRFFRAYVPLRTGDSSLALVGTLRIAPEVTHAQSVILDWYKENERLKLFRNQLKSGNIMTLLMITMLLFFSALWFGFYLAREITVPIQRLAEGMQAVSRGNLDLVIRGSADDEIGFLIKSFNRMTADLKGSRAEVERRRLYTEAILGNLAVAVIGLDSNEKILAINASALKLFGLAPDAKLEGSALSDIISGNLLDVARELLLGFSSADGLGVAEKEAVFSSQGREGRVVITGGTIADERGGKLGTILIFDDVTELVKAQHMSAWREVARRIAHEIKNPLTPIQLSAQRLERLVQDPQSAPVVKECTEAIVENVDSIKRLANEFTNFARMPTVEFTRGNLNSVVADAIAPYAETHDDIVFQFISESKAPEIQMDPEQIRRTVINLIENATTAIRADRIANGGEIGRIVVKTGFDPRRKVVSLEIADNGPGIQGVDKTRIFEPYFSTKREGTGLGLAIVTSIVADHQGVIRVYDNLPRGARFVIELPVEQKQVTQRRLAV